MGYPAGKEMMKNSRKFFELALGSIIAISLCASVSAQTKGDVGKGDEKSELLNQLLKLPAIPENVIKSEITYQRINQLSMVKFILPLLLKKSQYNSLLITIEKCRRQELEIREKDATELAKLDKKIGQAITDGIESGKLPSQDFQTEIIKLQKALFMRRQIATGEMVDMILETCKKSLNAGQIKAMANAMDPKAIDPEAKPSQMSDDEKVKSYIRFVLLDGTTYEILKQLAKRATE
jgi:hypothetical protein